MIQLYGYLRTAKDVIKHTSSSTWTLFLLKRSLFFKIK